MKKLRVGVIGCGRISVRHFIPITSIEDVELVACCDIKKERADEAAEKYGIKAYYSYTNYVIYFYFILQIPFILWYNHSITLGRTEICLVYY